MTAKAPTPAECAGHAHLSLRSKTETTRPIPAKICLVKSMYLIGREQGMDLSLDSKAASNIVSRRHAVLLLDGDQGGNGVGQWVLRDCGSMNGCTVNNIKISAMALRDRDLVGIGCAGDSAVGTTVTPLNNDFVFEYRVAKNPEMLPVDTPVRRGMVMKLGSTSVIKSWKAKTICAFYTENRLDLYDEREDDEPSTSIDLRSCEIADTLQDDEDAKKKLVFRIKTPDRDYVFKCNTRTQRDDWMFCLQQIVERAGKLMPRAPPASVDAGTPRGSNKPSQKDPISEWVSSTPGGRSSVMAPSRPPPEEIQHHSGTDVDDQSSEEGIPKLRQRSSNKDEVATPRRAAPGAPAAASSTPPPTSNGANGSPHTMHGAAAAVVAANGMAKAKEKHKEKNKDKDRSNKDASNKDNSVMTPSRPAPGTPGTASPPPPASAAAAAPPPAASTPDARRDETPEEKERRRAARRAEKEARMMAQAGNGPTPPPPSAPPPSMGPQSDDAPPPSYGITQTVQRTELKVAELDNLLADVQQPVKKRRDSAAPRPTGDMSPSGNGSSTPRRSASMVAEAQGERRRRVSFADNDGSTPLATAVGNAVGEGDGEGGYVVSPRSRNNSDAPNPRKSSSAPAFTGTPEEDPPTFVDVRVPVNAPVPDVNIIPPTPVNALQAGQSQPPPPAYGPTATIQTATVVDSPPPPPPAKPAPAAPPPASAPAGTGSGNMGSPPPLPWETAPAAPTPAPPPPAPAVVAAPPPPAPPAPPPPAAGVHNTPNKPPSAYDVATIKAMPQDDTSTEASGGRHPQVISIPGLTTATRRSVPTTRTIATPPERNHPPPRDDAGAHGGLHRGGSLSDLHTAPQNGHAYEDGIGSPMTAAAASPYVTGPTRAPIQVSYNGVTHALSVCSLDQPALVERTLKLAFGVSQHSDVLLTDARGMLHVITGHIPTGSYRLIVATPGQPAAL